MDSNNFYMMLTKEEKDYLKNNIHCFTPSKYKYVVGSCLNDFTEEDDFIERQLRWNFRVYSFDDNFKELVDFFKTKVVAVKKALEKKKRIDNINCDEMLNPSEFGVRLNSETGCTVEWAKGDHFAIRFTNTYTDEQKDMFIKMYRNNLPIAFKNITFIPRKKYYTDNDLEELKTVISERMAVIDKVIEAVREINKMEIPVTFRYVDGRLEYILSYYKGIHFSRSCSRVGDTFKKATLTHNKLARLDVESIKKHIVDDLKERVFNMKNSVAVKTFNRDTGYTVEGAILNYVCNEYYKSEFIEEFKNLSEL